MPKTTVLHGAVGTRPGSPAYASLYHPAFFEAAAEELHAMTGETLEFGGRDVVVTTT